DGAVAAAGVQDLEAVSHQAVKFAGTGHAQDGVKLFLERFLASPGLSKGFAFPRGPLRAKALHRLAYRRVHCRPGRINLHRNKPGYSPHDGIALFAVRNDQLPFDDLTLLLVPDDQVETSSRVGIHEELRKVCLHDGQSSSAIEWGGGHLPILLANVNSK